MPRRDEDDEYEDFGARMAKQALGGRTALVIPQGLSLFRPKRSGSLTIDIVPYVVTEAQEKYDSELRPARVGKRFPERTYYNHRKVGVNGDSYACLGKTFGQACPICQAVAELKKSANKDDLELAKALKPSQRQLWLVYDNDDTDRGLQLWDEANWNFGKHLMSYIDGARKEERDAYKLFYHREKGYSIRLTCNKENIGGGDNYTYTVHAFYPRRTPIPDAIWDHGYDPDAMVRQLGYKAMRDIYYGLAEPEEVIPPEDSSRRDPPRTGRDTNRYEDPPPRREERDEVRSNGRPAKAPPPPVDDEPEPSTVTCATGDRVSFEYRGDTVEGEVLRIDTVRLVAFVEVEGSPKPYTVGMEDITVLEADGTFDRKPDPAPPAKKGKPPADDDGDRDPPPRQRNPPAPETKAAARGKGWDDDDEPDARSAVPAKKGKDEPPAKKPTRK